MMVNFVALGFGMDVRHVGWTLQIQSAESAALRRDRLVWSSVPPASTVKETERLIPALILIGEIEVVAELARRERIAVELELQMEMTGARGPTVKRGSLEFPKEPNQRDHG